MKGGSPYGYARSNGKGTSLIPHEGDIALELDELPEAPVVRRIFQLAIDGLVPTAIARLLNDEGIANPFDIIGNSVRSRPRTFGVDFGVTFEPQGLRARVELRRAAKD